MNEPAWLPEWDALLGTMGDADVASKIDRSLHVVRAHRMALRVPPYRLHRRSSPPMTDLPPLAPDGSEWLFADWYGGAIRDLRPGWCAAILAWNVGRSVGPDVLPGRWYWRRCSRQSRSSAGRLCGQHERGIPAQEPTPERRPALAQYGSCVACLVPSGFPCRNMETGETVPTHASRRLREDIR
jgi:hypothetical protein